MNSNAISYMEASLAPKTRRAYDRAFQDWESYAIEEDIPVLPIAPIDLCNIVANIAVETGSMSKVNLLIAAVADKHLSEHLESPTADSSFRKMMIGVRKRLFYPSKSRSPLDKEILKDAYEMLAGGGRLQDWRTLCRINLEFYGMMRWDEVSNLRMDDIQFTETGMVIKIRRSKTDQKGEGEYVRINMSEEENCPVEITRLYISKLGYGTENGFLQPQIRTYKDGTQSGVWHTKLGYSTALEDLKAFMAIIGRDPREYGEHSGRRGGATAASEAGVSWLDLKRHGRWASDSSAQKYIEDTKKRSNKVPAVLAACSNNNNAPADVKEPRAKRRRNAIKTQKKSSSGAAESESHGIPRSITSDTRLEEDTDRQCIEPALDRLIQKEAAKYTGPPGANAEQIREAREQRNQPAPYKPVFFSAAQVWARQQREEEAERQRQREEREKEEDSDTIQLSPGTFERLFEEEF